MWRRISYETLPALKVGGLTLRRSMRTVTLAWMVGVVWMACISGSQMTNWCWLLGFDDFDFGILAAIPWAATIFQLLAAVMIEHTGLRKWQFIIFATLHRALWIAIALVPLMAPLPSRRAVMLFLFIFAASCSLAQLSVPPWNTWMGDLIPRRLRARYFAARNLWTNPINLAVTIVAALILDHVANRQAPAWLHEPLAAALALPQAAAPGAGFLSLPAVVGALATPMAAPLSVWTQPALLITLMVLFAVGGVFGTMDVLAFLRMRDIAVPRQIEGPPRLGLARTLRTLVVEPANVMVEAFRDHGFRHYALYAATITFSITVGGNYFWTNALKNLAYSNLGANVVFLVCGVVAAMAMAPLWGKAIDRWGRRPTLMIAVIGTVSAPVGWLFVRPGDLATAYIAGGVITFVVSAVWVAVDLANTSIVLGFAQSSGRSKLVAAAGVVAAIGGFIGGLSGGYITQGFQSWHFDWGPFNWCNYHLTFIAAGIARAGSLVFLVGMPEPGSRPVGHVFRQIVINPFNNIAMRIWPLSMLVRWRPAPPTRQGRDALDDEPTLPGEQGPTKPPG